MMLARINPTRLRKWEYSAIPYRWQWRVDKKEITIFPDVFRYTVQFIEDQSQEVVTNMLVLTERGMITVCDQIVKSMNDRTN